MNIIFDSVYIHNFQSIGDASIQLSDRGVVTVYGVNEYDDNAQSNGSGKSSIFSGIFWALYGKTPEGISDPTNKYSNGICNVKLEFTVDDNKYVIDRSIKSSQSVSVNVNGTDQSGRNRSDTDKIIRDDILKMSPDIFLSLVYLSQGFSNRLSSLTPSGRKDRLEQLTETAQLIDTISNQISERKSYLSSQVMQMKTSIAKKEGSIETIENSIDELKRKLASIELPKFFEDSSGKRYTVLDIPGLQEQIDAVYQQQVELQKHSSDLISEKSKCDIELKSLNLCINDYSSRKLNATNSLESVNSHGVCPECNQPLLLDKKEALKFQYLEEIKTATEKISEVEKQISEWNSKRDNIINEHNELKSQLSNIASIRDSLSYILQNIPKEENISSEEIQSDICKYEFDKEKIEEQKSKDIENLGTSEVSLDIISHCQQLASKAFRSYLLKNIISYMNNQLLLYSSYLFSNGADVISISEDSQKLDILLGDADYVTLSGGERRKVDLAVMLAQRDLSRELAGMSCNILILDEIMESMDETATHVTLELLERQSESVDSMFIISHNNYSLPVDSKIRVVKGKNRISAVITE